MKTKFTKGDWFVERYHTMLDISVKDGGCICTVDTDTVMNKCTIIPTPEQEANAHLIASAPGMYKSLKRQRIGLLNLIDLNLVAESHYESVRHEVSLIDNELAKARGE